MNRFQNTLLSILGTQSLFLVGFVLFGDAYFGEAAIWILGIWSVVSIGGIVLLHCVSNREPKPAKWRGFGFFMVYLMMIIPTGLFLYMLFLMYAFSQVTDWR